MARSGPPVTLTGSKYVTVAASQTTSVLGVNGGKSGDYVARLIIVPASTNAGAVSLLDNTTSMTIFTGGTASVTTLAPIEIEFRAHSVAGPWKVTTGSSVSVVAVGDFT